jgi:hypothetical protein
LATVAAIKSWIPCEHLDHDTSQSPPVHTFAITLLMKDFGSEVLGSTTHGKGIMVGFDSHFGEAEVGDTDVSLKVNQNIFRLQVAVYDVMGMEKFESQNNLTCEKQSLVLVETAFVL